MSDQKAHGVNFVTRKSSTKKIGFVVVVEGLGLLGYFRNINILGYILYSTVLCNYYHIHSEVFSSIRGFSHESFHVNMIFFFVFVFHYCVIDHNRHGSNQLP